MSEQPRVIHRTRSHHRLPHHPPPSTQLPGVPIPTSYHTQHQSNSRSPPPNQQHPTSPPTTTSSFRPRTRARSSSSGTSSSTSESDGDDVPLAQRIPTALRAQKTIRRQVRDEKDKRRAERARARTQTQNQDTAALEQGMAGLGLTSSQEAAAMAAACGGEGKTTAPGQATSKPIARSGTRARARTLTGKDERPPLQPPVQAQVAVPFAHYHQQQQQFIPVQHQNHQQHQGYQLQDQPAPRGRTMEDAQPKRSLSQHRRDPPTSPPPAAPPVPNPGPSFSGVARAMTLSSRHGRRPDPGVNTDFGPAPDRAGRSLGRSNTTARARSQSRHQQHLNLPDPSSFPLPPRPSIDPSPSADPRHSRVVLVEKKDHRYDAVARKGTLPSSSQDDGGGDNNKLRVYMGDSETYNIVPYPAPSTQKTNAKDIILAMQDAGMMKGWVGSGEWMLWEVWGELGVERPIRTFEAVGDVLGAWGKLGQSSSSTPSSGASPSSGATKGNRLIAKISGLAPVLSRSALPSSAPMCSGYVDFEAKRGKWVKKWLMLRENAVFVAKRENAKEELLCSLSNFDAYIVTRAFKAPKPFTFALKSTDDLSFFEDKRDYIHLISCEEKTGWRWMERVLLARSFVLYQEKSTLFTASNGAAPTALSRSGTTSRKRAPTLLGSEPLNYPANPVPPPHGHGVFEPGSLLGRQQAQRV